MAVVGQKTKGIKYLMGIIDIIGKPKYRSQKLEEEQEQSMSSQKESKKRLSDPDIEYKRDEKDWWWCDDVWPIDYRIKSSPKKTLTELLNHKLVVTAWEVVHYIKDKPPTIADEGLLFW